MPTFSMPIAYTQGIQGRIGRLEVEITPRESVFTVTNLPDTATEQLRVTVSEALRSAGYALPPGAIVITTDSLSRNPNHCPHVAIAVALLVASGQLTQETLHDLYLGHLNCAGEIRHVPGVFPMFQAAAQAGIRRAYVPEGDTGEAALTADLKTYPVRSLRQLVEQLSGAAPLVPTPRQEAMFTEDEVPGTYLEMNWQGTGPRARRILEIAAAGRHHIALVGPTASGKTALARTLAWLMPPLNPEELQENLAIRSVADQLPAEPPYTTGRPFRAPHHTISLQGITGSRRLHKPGEVTLSHNGVLFLDEVNRLPHDYLGVIAETMANRSASLSWLDRQVNYPADFTLALSVSACPCGYKGVEGCGCICRQEAIQRHRRAVPTDLIERIHLSLFTPDYDSARIARPVSEAKDRVSAAWRRREEHEAKGHSLDLDQDAAALLDDWLGIEAESQHWRNPVIAVAATIADLLGLSSISRPCAAEALFYCRPIWPQTQAEPGKQEAPHRTFAYAPPAYTQHVPAQQLGMSI